jgi:DNA-binding IclR family transcriptional regulator
VIPAKTPSVPALERGLAILELVAKSHRGLTFSQIARSLDFPKSSIHCLLLTFEREGYLRRSEATGKYVCGMKLVRIANLALEGIILREKATPLLRTLMERAGLTVHMAILERNEVVLIAKAEPPGVPRVATWIGKRIDVHCTSLGKCLIAWLPEEEIERLTRGRGLLRHNENTIASLGKLKKELERTRRRGYAVDDEEEEIGVRCIGAPVFGQEGHVVAAMSVSGTIEQIHPGNCSELAGLVKHVAGEVSQQLAAFRESSLLS